jgi:putative transport protein
MIDLLVDNPLLLLFVVVAIGYPLGRVRVAGSSIGVAAVLFAGLAVGALDEELRVPAIVYQLGLVLFVYTIGLSSGPGFFASLRRKGAQHSLLVLGMLLVAAGFVWLAKELLDLRATYGAGLFAGSLTNTPALAGVLDYLRERETAGEIEALLAEPVVGYSVAYPIGVVGMILSIGLLRRLWRVDYARERQRAGDLITGVRELENRTIRVTNSEAAGATVRDLALRHGWDVVFGRIARGGHHELAGEGTTLALGDLVSVIGTSADVERVAATLGETTGERLELDRHELDFRRIFVSNPRVAGHRLRDLNLPQQYGALVTRLRRGDVEFVPHGETILEYGDRLRVVTTRENMPAVSRFLGDSYRALSEIDILTFSLGLAAGLLLGVVPIPLAGGLTIELGLAGGPLIVALVLGWLGRTGPFVWGLPYSANLTLRQIGLILFLAGVGTGSGRAFFETVASAEGLALFIGGAAITVVVAVTTLTIGYKLLGVPFGLLTGVLAGLQTQPAVLGFALEESDDELPNIGYATVYPIATIAKIVLAQALLAVWL